MSFQIRIRIRFIFVKNSLIANVSGAPERVPYNLLSSFAFNDSLNSKLPLVSSELYIKILIQLNTYSI